MELFGKPWVLLFLVFPALLVWFTWRRRGRRTVLPFDHAVAGSGRWLAGAVQSAESLPALGLAVAILLWAEPQKLTAPKVQRALTNIEFCVDISGSMSAQFGGGTRYDAAMRAINQFLDYREGDAFGLTFFGNSVLHWVPLTNDVSAFRCAPPFMRPDRAPPWFGGTEIGKALLACREVLVQREEGDRMIILVSDGVSADLFGDRATEIARDMQRDNISVYGVHISESEVPGDIVNITAQTGGHVFQPGDPASLEDVFRRIDEMAKAELEKGAAEYVDDFVALCVIGLSLLGLFALTQLFLRYTPW